MLKRGIPFNAFFLTTFVVTFAMLMVALYSINSHQNAMRDLVAERDQRSVRLLSALVSDQIEHDGVTVAALTNTLNDLVDDEANSSVFVVNGSGEVIYQRGHLHDNGTALLRHDGVAEALAGNEGILFADAPDGEHIVAYTRIANTDWALLLEEPLNEVITMQLNSTLIAPLTLLPLLVMMLMALWFGGRQIVRPLQILAQRADAVGNGEIEPSPQSVGGISEIRQLDQHLATMAQRVHRAQRSLQDYASAVTQGQEEERRRLARELHDGAIQTLTVMHQEIQLAKWDVSDDDAIRSMLHTVDHEVATLTTEMRQIVRALRPGYLEELGLVAALEALTRDYARLWSLPIQFDVEGPELRLDSTEELALYRIAQEALHNIRKHAEATEAVVFLVFQPTRTQLTILDNGKGFTPPRSLTQTASAGHFGLLGIYERAELVSATVDIHSSETDGTQFTVTIPYDGSSTIG